MPEAEKQDGAIHAEVNLQYTIEGSSTVLAERRRPGRLQTVSPHLLPLLRRSERKLPVFDPDAEEGRDELLESGGVAGSAAIHDEPAYHEDRLPDGSGVIIAAVGGALIWGLIITAVMFL